MSPTKRATPRQAPVPSDLPAACLRLAQQLKLISGPSHRVMLTLPGEGERSVSEIATAMGAATSSPASRSLVLLRLAGIVTRRRDGQRVFYSLTDEGRALLEIVDILSAADADRTR
jgi:DNA-binding transcriptional ArsR family regulator